MDAVAESCGVAKQTFPQKILDQQIANRERQSRDLQSHLGKQANSVDAQSLSQIEIEWGLAQDELWQKEAPQKVADQNHGK
jgi:hypothetical protein